jgi:glutathione synthase
LPLLADIAAFLKYHGIFFAGIDMIGKYITEINITSPTGLQQIGKGLSNKISNKLLESVKIFHEFTK